MQNVVMLLLLTGAAAAPDLSPYVGKTCSIQNIGPSKKGSNVDTIIRNNDGTFATHHTYTTPYSFGLHDGGVRPLKLGDDGWYHFTSDSGSQQAYQPGSDSQHLNVSISGVGSFAYECK